MRRKILFFSTGAGQNTLRRLAPFFLSESSANKNVTSGQKMAQNDGEVVEKKFQADVLISVFWN